MKIVEGLRDPKLNDALAAWCARKIGIEAIQPPYSTLGIFDGEELAAVVVYNNFHPGAGVVEMHSAARTPRWLTRPVLWAMFDFAFNRLNCQTVVLRVAPDNARMRRIAKAYGFSEHVLPRLRGRDADEIVCLLHDDVWQANGFHCQHQQRRAA